MKSYKAVVRGEIYMPWQPTDVDLKIMGCYYESPIFSVAENMDNFDIIDYAYDTFFSEFKKVGIFNTLELVVVG